MLLASSNWFINYLSKLLSHEFLRIQDRLSIKNQPNRTLVSGIYNSYAPVHSYNILAITHVLGFASDLGNN